MKPYTAAVFAVVLLCASCGILLCNGCGDGSHNEVKTEQPPVWTEAQSQTLEKMQEKHLRLQNELLDATRRLNEQAKIIHEYRSLISGTQRRLVKLEQLAGIRDDEGRVVRENVGAEDSK